MARTNFVCTMCPQTFTRRWRGNTHNTNLHSGGGRIVRFVDYIIGRLDGQYFAGDPTLYRRKISNVLSHEGIFDLERVFETNKEKSAMRNQEKEEVNRIAEHIEDFSQFQSATHPRIQQNEELNQMDSLFDITGENKNIIIKIAKIKKYYVDTDPLKIYSK